MLFCPLRTCLGLSIVAAFSLSTSAAVWAKDHSTGCHGDRIACDTMLGGERALTAMMVSGDVNIVERLFADDAVWSLGDGTRWTKGEAIATLRKTQKMARSRLLKADVRQFGTTAIVLWTESWRAMASDHDEQTNGTDTWMLRAGRWQIIASQEAHAPATMVR